MRIYSLKKVDLKTVAQSLSDGVEGRPLLGYGVPTLAHKAVQRPGTVVWRLEAASVGHQLHNLLFEKMGLMIDFIGNSSKFLFYKDIRNVEPKL